MAGGASAVTSARVLQMNAFAKTDVEQRLRLPVFVIRKLAMFELDGLPVDRYLRHSLIIGVRRQCCSKTTSRDRAHARDYAPRFPSRDRKGALRERGSLNHSSLVTYLLTFSCYGSRLHGDEPGSVDPRHNIPGHRLVEPNTERVSSARDRMNQEPYEMDEARRRNVLASILEHCQHRNWRLLAAHVRTNHVHTIVDAPVTPEKVLNELKAYASRMLNKIGLDSPDRRRWSRHGSTRYLWKREDVEAAIVYVADHQGNPMAMYVNEDRW